MTRELNKFDVNEIKVCKALWIISGKSKDTFDKKVWPIVTEQ